MSLSKEEILEFISNTNPNFSKVESMGVTMYKMFTAPTQHIVDENLENLIARGMKAYKKYGNKSAFTYIVENLQLPTAPKNFKTDDTNPQEYVAQVFHKHFPKLFKENE